MRNKISVQKLFPLFIIKYIFDISFKTDLTRSSILLSHNPEKKNTSHVLKETF